MLDVTEYRSEFYKPNNVHFGLRDSSLPKGHHVYIEQIPSPNLNYCEERSQFCFKGTNQFSCFYLFLVAVEFLI